MMKKTKAENIIIVVLFLLFVIVGGGLGYSIIMFFGNEIPWWQAFLYIVAGVLLMYLALFLQIILHELGHMIAALTRGWKFISFMIFGWVISRKNGRFHLTRFSIAGANGQCLMLPPIEGDTGRGIVIYNAGGVLMNIVTSLVAMIVLAGCHAFLPWGFAAFLVLFALAGLCFALVNGIPATMNGMPNDGKNIQQLRHDEFSTKVFLTTMRFMGRMQQGEAIDQIALGYLCEGQQLDYANPLHLSALTFDVSLAMARLDLEKAYELFAMIDEHESDMVGIFRNELTLEKVYLYLVAPRDDQDVKDLMNAEFLKYMNALCGFRPSALRTKYAYTLLYEHNVQEAEQLRLQFDRVCNKYHILGEVKTEQHLVEYAASRDRNCIDKS